MPSTKVENKRMSMPEIKMKARGLGITPGKMNKTDLIPVAQGRIDETDLIHAIQKAEGNYTCFGWSNGNCQNIDCCFIGDCLKIRL